MKNKFNINQFVEVITPQSMARKLAEKEKTSRKLIVKNIRIHLDFSRIYISSSKKMELVFTF